MSNIAEMEDSIAIVGMACRFPGDSNSPDKLWRMCAEARDCWSEVPKSRYNIDGFHHPDPERNGSVNVRGGYFLQEDLALFDAAFFAISSSEAVAIDPQQRLLLECAYEALENGGVATEKIAGSSCGVFVGSFNRDYKNELERDPESIPRYHATGSEQSMLANRLSYVFDLRGPSISIDTACSASMTALHLACQSLKSGDCKQAIVGGSSLIINPSLTISMSMLRFFSPSARSYAFDSRACGYARGEGVGCLFLKPLKSAIADGDPIRAVIRGTGANQDGKTHGVTTPSATAQEALIRSVYRTARLDPSYTTYVEAHGTGTPTGDPLEAKAISQVFCERKTRKEALLMGSVKTNIGHLEGASGVAGIIKTVLMLEKGVILPHLNYERPNDKIDMQDWGLEIPTKLRTWPSCQIRRASVNSFGFGGANAHAILDAYIHKSKMIEGNGYEDKETTDKHHLFIISANDRESTKAYAQSLNSYITESEGPEQEQADFLAKLAFTLGERRSVFAHRLAYTASSTEELKHRFEHGNAPPTKSFPSPELVYVFTGQGAQWFGMGRELISRYAVFRTSLVTAEQCLKRLGASWSLQEELTKSQEESRVNDSTVSQALCTALQISMVDLLRSWGLEPTKVVGHSSGEIAAAYAASALTFDNCLKVAYYRGIASAELTSKHPNLEGSMLAVGASPEEVQDALGNITDGKAVIACYNGPDSVTVSGDQAAIEQLHRLVTERGLFSRKLRVSHAYHSHHMSLVSETYRKLMGTIEATDSPSVEVWSSVSTGKINPKEMGTNYWVENLLAPVKFSQALSGLLTSSPAHPMTLVEVGPHAALGAPIQSLLATLSNHNGEKDLLYAPTLLRHQNATVTMLGLAGTLFCRGHNVNISKVNSYRVMTGQDVVTDLPPYAWNHKQRFWHETRYARDYLQRSEARSDLLGSIAPDATSLEPRWRNVLRLSEMPWLNDHVIQSQIVYPAAGYVAMAIEGSLRIAAAKNIIATTHMIREMSIVKALVLPEAEGEDLIETAISFRPYSESHRSWSENWNEFRITSWNSRSGWTEHCRGLVSSRNDIKSNEVDGNAKSMEEYRAAKASWCIAEEACTEEVDVKQLYHQLSTIGMELGSSFRCIKTVCVGEGVATGNIVPGNTAALMPLGFEFAHVIHPGTLDSLFQTLLLAFYGHVKSVLKPLVPTFIEEFTISGSPQGHPQREWKCYSAASPKGSREMLASINAHDISDAGTAIQIKGLIGTLLEPEVSNHTNEASQQKLCKIAWHTDVEISPECGFSNRTDESSTKTDPITFSSKMLLENTARVYIDETLRKVGETEIDPRETHLVKLYRWMKLQKEAGGATHCKANGGQFSKSQSENNRNEGLLLDRIGTNLDKILKGLVSPLSLMAQDNLVGNYNESNLLLSSAIKSAVEYTKTLAFKKPDMNILEIGAGSGFATFPILQALGDPSKGSPRFSRYVVTDVDATILDQYRPRFQSWGTLVEFGTLDIEVSPQMQSYRASSFDLIIAVNVLHKTSEIKRSLQNIRSLLKPGGRLLMIEMTKDLPHLQLIWGTLPEWWCGREKFRQASPLLSREKWQSLLSMSGFSGLSATSGNSKSEAEHYCSTMVSKAAAPSHAALPPFDIITHKVNPIENLNRLANAIQNSTNNAPTVTDFEKLVPEEKFYTFLVGEPFLHGPSEKLYQNLQSLLATARGVLWVHQEDPMTSAAAEADFVLGLARTVRNENPLIRFVTLDLDLSPKLGRKHWDAAACDTIIKVLVASFGSEVDSDCVDLEYREKQGVVEIPRMVYDTHANASVDTELGHTVHTQGPFYQNDRRFHLEIESPGLLDSLHFVDDKDTDTELPDEFVELDVKSCGVNFRDVMVATGHIDQADLGTECSGIITAVGSGVKHLKLGDRVFGWAANTYARSIRCQADGLHVMPEGLTFAAAASLPNVYCTAIYALIDIANLRKGETVLIHAAAGGVGQAAIMLCQYLGAEIYVTVGTPTKKVFLMEKYGLKEENVFFSRDESFAAHVMARTCGRGVDVILNSLAGEQLRHSWDCIAPFGRFLEIGKRDMTLNTRLEMKPFFRNVIFASIDMILVRDLRIELIQRLLQETCRLLEQGVIAPVQPLHTVGFADIESAFRKLQNGQHYGKFVAIPSSSDIVKIRTSKPSLPRIRADATYIVVGGFGGIGRTIARWLVDHGARHLVLISRNGPNTDSSKSFLGDLQSRNVNVLSESCDIGETSQLKRLLQTVQEKNMPPIRGVIQGAMVLRDSPFETMPFTNFVDVVRPKVQGTWNLHDQLSKSDLDFFILLSSASGVIGNRAQAAYAAGSTFLDAFALYRRQLNLPAISLDLGVVLEVGYVAENKQVQAQLGHISLSGMAENELLALIKVAIEEQSKPTYSHQLSAGISLERTYGQVSSETLPFWASDARFSHLRKHALAQNSSNGAHSNPAARSFRQSLLAAETVEEATTLIAEQIARKVAAVMGIDTSDVRAEESLSKYGVDSLAAVELRNWFWKEMKATVRLFELLADVPIRVLAEKIAAKSKMVKVEAESGRLD